MNEEVLNIVDDLDNTIGVETRNRIHEVGLLHREIHIYFVTPEKEVILQKRADNKDTYPSLLDATVGGHVEIGDSYEQTVLKEAREETGHNLDMSKIFFIKKIRSSNRDEATNKINNAIKSEYIYIFEGQVADLTIEQGKATGFEAWPIEKLLNLSESGKQKFVPFMMEFITSDLGKYIKEKL